MITLQRIEECIDGRRRIKWSKVENILVISRAEVNRTRITVHRRSRRLCVSGVRGTEACGQHHADGDDAAAPTTAVEVGTSSVRRDTRGPIRLSVQPVTVLWHPTVSGLGAHPGKRRPLQLHDANGATCCSIPGQNRLIELALHGNGPCGRPPSRRCGEPAGPEYPGGQAEDPCRSPGGHFLVYPQNNARVRVYNSGFRCCNLDATADE